MTLLAGEHVVEPVELRSVALRSGLVEVGVAPADRFHSTRAILEERRAAGLHGGMWFTYGNPERSTDPGRILKGARSLVVGAIAYYRALPSEDPASSRGATGQPAILGRVARHAWRDHYVELREALGGVAAWLEERGYRARVVADDNALVDREAAYRAGLGWYGKNSLILLPRRGSWFLLGSVVTDALVLPAQQTHSDWCGTCERCMRSCPTGALNRPGILDARRCLAWLLQSPGWFPREHRVALGDRLYGCDTCQDVCPHNRIGVRREQPPVADEADEPFVEVLWILCATDTEIMARLGRWYVPKREARFVKRNALLVLGNTADPRDPRVRAALHANLNSSDPLLRGHAVWACARLGMESLLSALRHNESDPRVLDELEAISEVPLRERFES
ncbi:MAG: tRNA epoxyqueuosine(34) reductase QueG [Actinobacteria bacterium]|nr:tRNA epoxyqueuosine(34) reductase QueG [Actinomycetota bacterium]